MCHNMCIKTNRYKGFVSNWSETDDRLPYSIELCHPMYGK